MTMDLVNELPSHIRVRYQLHRLLTTSSVGEKLPSEKALCGRFGVSRPTLRRAIAALADDGILMAKRGAGTFICRVPTDPDTHDANARLIGLNVASVENPWVARVVKGIEEAAAERNYHIVLTHHHCDAELQAHQLEQLSRRNLAGILTSPGNVISGPYQRYADLLNTFLKQGTPVVQIDRYLSSIDIPCVLGDNYRGGYLAGEHLAMTGRRNIALLGLGHRHAYFQHDLRYRGFVNALRDYDLLPKPVLQANLGLVEHARLGKEIVEGWLHEASGSSPVDAIFCMQDNMAYGAYLALREAGLKVPEDVSLVGYDNLDRDLYRNVDLELTSIDQSAERLGAATVRRLLDEITCNVPPNRPRHVLIPPRLIVRRSSDPTATSSHESDHAGSHSKTRQM